MSAKQKSSAGRPTKAVVMLRAEEILRIRLDGAEFHDVREWVREQEQLGGVVWRLPEGRKPLSDPTLWRYIALADRLIAENCQSSRRKTIRLRVAMRHNLYAKAVNSGDIRTALAVLDSLDKLQGLYPSADAETLADIRRLKEQIAALAGPDSDTRGQAPVL